MKTFLSNKTLIKWQTTLKVVSVFFILTFWEMFLFSKAKQPVSNALIIAGIVFALTFYVLDVIIYNKKKVLFDARRSECTSE